MIEFYCYKKCSTCSKAKKWLDNQHIEYKYVEITEQRPSKEMFKKWLGNSEYSGRYLFNTSGQIYRKLNLKDKLDNMSIDQKAELLSNEGMLIKRPLIVDGSAIMCGFNEKEYAKKFL